VIDLWKPMAVSRHGKKTAPISSEPPDIGSNIASIRELYAIDKKFLQ
jgi:hypothetical protein